MDDLEVPGAWPLRGFGPREGLPGDLVWPSRRGEPEGPTEWQTRSGEYRRVGAGFWVPGSVAMSPEQRVVEAGASLPAYGAVTGWAALRWLGALWFDGTGPDRGTLPVALAVGDAHAKRKHPGVEVSQEILPPGTIRRVRGLRVTCPLWSVAYEMRKATSAEAAVVAFELAAMHDLVSVAELRDYVDSALWIRQGVPRVRDLLPILEENSWSPKEPVMRLTWTAARPRKLLANHPVFTLDGRFVGTPDLVDPEAGIYGMYDGALHLAAAVRHGDVAKEAAYRALGMEGASMMAGDLGDRDAFVGRLHEAYARADRRAAEDRRWRTDPPPWWIPTFTVAQRRALTAAQRRRLLRYRPAA